MVYTLHLFSSKRSLFHNSNIFGSGFIHILYTECAKIKKKIIPAPKGWYYGAEFCRCLLGYNFREHGTTITATFHEGPCGFLRAATSLDR